MALHSLSGKTTSSPDDTAPHITLLSFLISPQQSPSHCTGEVDCSYIKYTDIIHMDCNKITDMFNLSMYYVVMVDKPTSRPFDRFTATSKHYFRTIKPESLVYVAALV